MRGGESGTLPEFKVVNFRVVKKGRCVIGIMGTTTASVRYAWGGWRRSAQRGRSERGTGDRTGSVRVRQTGKSLLGALLTTFRGSGIQFLVILCFPGIREGSELMDREFATKAMRKDGRKGDLAVAWEARS